MKAYLVIAVAALMSIMVEAKVNRTIGLSRLIFGDESLAADNPEMVDEEEEKSDVQMCCSPKSFQSTVNIYQPGRPTPSQAKILIDAANNRLAIITGARRQVISCSACSCTVTNIVERLRYCGQRILRRVTFDDLYSLCIPSIATREGTVRMGNKGFIDSSMLIQQWAFSTGNHHIRKMVTANGCFPVAEIVNRAGGPYGSNMVTAYYFDMVSPVMDVKSFAIPAYCPKATEEEEAVSDEEPDLTPFYLRFK